MKKLILTLILCLIAVPAYAGIYIDGQPQNTDYKIIDGRTYVPLRFVSEKLNAAVSYDGDIKITTKQPTRPVIKTGTQEQKQVVSHALDLLQLYDPPHYNMICNYVEEIYVSDKQIRLEDGEPFAIEFMNSIILYKSLVKDEKRFTPEYVAGVLVHEGAHASSDQVIPYELNPNLNEEIAYEHQITALLLVGASQWAVDEITAWQKRYLD